MTSWFDPEGIDLEAVLEHLAGSDVTYFRLRVGETELVFSAEPPAAGEGAPASAHAEPVPPSGQPTAAAASSAVQAAPAADPRLGDGDARAGDHVVASPMAGRFHRSPSPGAAPFVVRGDEVGADSTLGLVETMKIFSAVQAGCSGVVLEVLAGNGQVVERGDALARLRPAQTGQLDAPVPPGQP